MQPEPGDDYLRALALSIRRNEHRLAQATFARPRRPPPTWLAPDTPLVFSTDIHHLFYVLMRFEALGYSVGTLDVQLDNPSRPTTYVNFDQNDKSDTLSLASFRSSFSAVSNLSLGAGWWFRSGQADISSELKYIFSSFTKLPAVAIGPPTKKVIAETVDDMASANALPLDVFKNLQSLECTDIDPRLILGWDRLSESLRSLKIRKSGLEDVADIFIGAVVDDQARRAGSTSRKRRRHIPRRDSNGQHFSFNPTPLPDAVPEEDEHSATRTHSPPLSTQLPSFKWAFLRHLSLADNNLTFIPQEILPYLASLTHLDLSSNLFVSVPAGLGALYNLVYLNLSDNMIDSVLGIYLNLGQVLRLNLSSNRLESICGLERLRGLEHIDLRKNQIEESAEIGRLATLPNVVQVWIEGNPFCDVEENYRVACFDYFHKERKTVTLDGTPPGFYEKRSLAALPPDQMTSSRRHSTASLPPVVAVAQSPPVNDVPIADEEAPVSSNASPHIAPVSAGVAAGKAPRKKAKRIVDLDGTAAQFEGQEERPKEKKKDKSKLREVSGVDLKEASLPRRGRHGRYHTDIAAVMDEEGEDIGKGAEAYRRRLEALQKDMGEGWLKVYSQTQT
ncbi:hypothetical protein Agabi119p4_1884 [Agaricus bisporus var. burnettii]|uniref:Uncharacterized protein n=1 Tax=Agaricus bisporus var. burnettii TaxID=192524 RepID=A0A8H7KJR6_AGABI|nr:hypothetical protein Agabi119p4_1884 [Agaricus bisporus var. burnettii]